MTVDVRDTPDRVDLVFSGDWTTGEAIAVKRTLTELRREAKKVVLDLRSLGSWSLELVQLILAFIRYARSIPRPVSVLVSADHRRDLRFCGLDRAGWEAFFHAG